MSLPLNEWRMLGFTAVFGPPRCKENFSQQSVIADHERTACTYLRAHDVQPGTRVSSKIRACGHRTRRPSTRLLPRRHEDAVVSERRVRGLVLFRDRWVCHIGVDAQ